MSDDDTTPNVQRKAATYSRQPSVWPATNRIPPRSTRVSGRRFAGRIGAGVTMLGLVAGPPWLLWAAFGNPVTAASVWWTSEPFSDGWPNAPGAGLRLALIWAGWLAWALLVTLLAGSLAGAVTGRHLPRWRLPMPLHRLLFGITGTTTVALASPATAAMAASPAPHVVQTASLHSAAVPVPSIRQDTAARAYISGEPVTVTVSQNRYEYRVRKGDTLSKVAEMWLSDADRWPDICRLNKHRHFNTGTLTDCDLIYPGWHLRLPADAVPPPDAKPLPPRPGKPSTTEPTTPESEGPVPRAPRSQGDARPPATPRSGPATTPGTPLASTTPPASPTTPPPPSATVDPTGAPGAKSDRAGDDLVLPGGTVIPWALAVAIAAAGGLVWLQRRRRYEPTASDDDLPDLPAPVLAAQHHTRHAITPEPAESSRIHGLPSGGVGLVGSGADAAARGLIITALTAGTPAEPASRAEVIIDRHALTALLGDTTVSGWARLHITDTLEQSLTLLDTHLLRRARILDEYNLTDLNALRATAPSEEALPPLLLITDTEEAAAASTRARITFGLTRDLDIITVVLGHWAPGPHLSVSDDGDARLQPDTRDAALQLAVLDEATTRDLLTTTREAHTGELSPNSAPTPAPAPSTPATPLISQPSTTDADAVTATPALTRARLRVLGKPRIEDITADGRPLRAKALELAVFLAVHPDGASTREIGEYLEPDARLSQADQRVHTNASNLRHVLGRAGTVEPKNAYVIKATGRYRLDPATVDVDVWALRDLMRKATIAAEPRRRELLTAACDLCSAPLAEGQDYEWVQPHRETVRRWGTEAHLLLAEDLLDSDTQAASDLLDKAIGLDRYNEALYAKAMHARHALADADGIRNLLRALAKALADLDAEPREETIDLANKLRTSLEKT